MGLSSCEIAALNGEGLFTGLLDQEPFAVLLKRPDWLRTYEPGAIVLHKGEDGGGASAVIHGTLEVLLYNRQGDERMVRAAGAGDCVGLEAAFGEVVLSYEARAITRIRLIHVPKSQLLAWVDASPVFARRLMLALAQDTRRLYEEIDGQGRSMLQRLACYLHCGEGRGKAGDERRDHFTVSLPYIKLAQRLGTSQPHLSRSLRRLEEAGVIERLGRHIRVVDSTRFSDLLCSTCLKAV